jgi:hypothetical protein
MLFPNTSGVFGIADIRVHDPMAYDRYMGFLRLTAGYKAGGESYFAWFDRPAAPVLDFLNVRYLLQDRAHAPRRSDGTDHLERRIDLREQVLPAALLCGGQLIVNPRR